MEDMTSSGDGSIISFSCGSFEKVDETESGELRLMLTV